MGALIKKERVRNHFLLPKKTVEPFDVKMAPKYLTGDSHIEMRCKTFLLKLNGGKSYALHFSF